VTNRLESSTRGPGCWATSAGPASQSVVEGSPVALSAWGGAGAPKAPKPHRRGQGTPGRVHPKRGAGWSCRRDCGSLGLETRCHRVVPPTRERQCRCSMTNAPKQTDAKPAARYFHGGNRGLKVGDHILPPSETGRDSASDFGARKVHRKDRVYVSTRLSDAEFFCIPKS
jgi:hypothetical protein